MAGLDPRLDPLLEEVADAGLASSPPRRSRAELVVSVGTDHHRFDRLIGWIDEWRDLHPDVVVVVQAGTSEPSRHGDSRKLIPHGDLLELFRRAAAVVSHGGPSTVMDARMSGRLPIVVARNPAYHEHVDEHQMRFAEHLDRHRVAVVVDDRDSLFAAIERALADPDAFTVAVDHDTAAGVVGFGAAVDQLLATTTPITAGGADAGADDTVAGMDMVAPSAVPSSTQPASRSTSSPLTNTDRRRSTT